MSAREEFHTPVLLKETLELLVNKKNGTYLDGTLGGGGHFCALAGLLDKEGTMIGIDRDPQAVEKNRSRIQDSSPRVIIEQCRYSEFEKVLDKYEIRELDGILLDLGLSSWQIDTPERGFSYMQNNLLDMRMNPSEGRTASGLIETLDETGLERVLDQYGEVQHASRMARTIKSCSNKTPIKTSRDLTECLKREYGPNLQIKVLAKVFQALRIAVNDELGELRRFLDKVIGVLATGGRLAVISYHSLEDRMVKNFIRDNEGACTCAPQAPICTCSRIIKLKRVNKKAIKPGDSEIYSNPRARSARLRVAEKAGGSR